MDRRVVLTLAVVVLVSLSGCSALPIWDGGDSNGGAGTPTVPSPEPGGGGGDGPDVSYPDGFGPSGVTDPGAAVTGHVGSLTGTSGYIFSYHSVLQAGESQDFIKISRAADNTDGIAYLERQNSQKVIAKYYKNNTVYIRKDTDEDTTYNSTAQNYSMEIFTGIESVGPLLARVNYHNAEVIETEDGTFYRYSSAEVTNPGAILRFDVNKSDIKSFEVGIVVDENGVVRNARFLVEFRNDVSINANMGVSEIGTTDVERPDWFQQAAGS